MKERPILFSGAMVQAILPGAKTQTRRVVNPQPHWGNWPHRLDDRWLCAMSGDARTCPYGVPGDRLWVRESGWLDRSESRFFAYAATPQIAKQADLKDYYVEATELVTKATMKKHYKSIPSIFMPRWASRITLEVTEVRVQRLQEISEGDALAEGIQRPEDMRDVDVWDGAERTIFNALNQPVKQYSRLWDEINGKRKGCAWSDNPWVWCISFRRIEL